MNNELVKDRISQFPVMWGGVMEVITDYQKANSAFIFGVTQSSSGLSCKEGIWWHGAVSSNRQTYGTGGTMHVVTRGYLSVHCAVKDVRSFITFLGKTQSVRNNIRTSSNKMLKHLSKTGTRPEFYDVWTFPYSTYRFCVRKQETRSSTENSCMVTKRLPVTTSLYSLNELNR